MSSCEDLRGRPVEFVDGRVVGWEACDAEIGRLCQLCSCVYTHIKWKPWEHSDSRPSPAAIEPFISRLPTLGLRITPHIPLHQLLPIQRLLLAHHPRHNSHASLPKLLAELRPFRFIVDIPNRNLRHHRRPQSPKNLNILPQLREQALPAPLQAILVSPYQASLELGEPGWERRGRGAGEGGEDGEYVTGGLFDCRCF